MTDLVDFSRFFHFNNLLEQFDGISDFSFDKENFKDCGKFYQLTIPVEEEFNENNVDIKLTDNKIFSIKYSYNGPNVSRRYSLSRTLPNDADGETLNAEYNDNKITITVNKKTNNIKSLPIKKNK